MPYCLLCPLLRFRWSHHDRELVVLVLTESQTAEKYADSVADSNLFLSKTDPDMTFVTMVAQELKQQKNNKRISYI